MGHGLELKLRALLLAGFPLCEMSIQQRYGQLL